MLQMVSSSQLSASLAAAFVCRSEGRPLGEKLMRSVHCGQLICGPVGSRLAEAVASIRPALVMETLPAPSRMASSPLAPSTAPALL